MKRFFNWFNNLYPVWLVGLAVIAFLEPQTMRWFDKPWIFWSLAASMLGMGLTLNLEDFKAIGRMPGAVALGFTAQYTVMPFIGWLVARSLALEPGLAVGIILVASCPGGMASNLISYLARANLALSVVLTLCSTMLAFVFTPLWTSLLAGKYVPVDAWGLCLSALQLTVAPVTLGVLVRWKLPRTADQLGACGPTVAVLAFVLVTGGIVAASADEIAAHFGRLLLAAFALHVMGFAAGYAGARLLRYPESVARTVSIEVGMQNGGMAAALARQHFALLPLAAAAGVFSGVIQNILGGIAASIWKRWKLDDRIRRDIYYWKCDRPAAFHGTQSRGEPDARIARQLEALLRAHFDTRNVVLSPGAGQGNHLTWNAEIEGRSAFIRVENGPERDGQLAVESAVLDRVRAAGVPTPRVFGCDASRLRVPFAWQALERIAAPDLNHWFKQGVLDTPRVAFDIGQAVARWQAIALPGFGVLDASLCGYRSTYADYYHLRLEEHLAFLVQRGFLTAGLRGEITAEIDNHRRLLVLERGCLVHKDLALWNILGTPQEIAAFIDFDDAVSGDPLDDLSLLACFHNAAFLERAFAGYESVRPLPDEHRRRFWLHLLRNMIFKAVIRVGAGYFERDSGFFLIGSGSSGADLRRFTEERIRLALNGLRNTTGLDDL